jgi:hypothetical protein
LVLFRTYSVCTLYFYSKNISNNCTWQNNSCFLKFPLFSLSCEFKCVWLGYPSPLRIIQHYYHRGGFKYFCIWWSWTGKDNNYTISSNLRLWYLNNNIYQPLSHVNQTLCNAKLRYIVTYNKRARLLCSDWLTTEGFFLYQEGTITCRCRFHCSQ